MFLKANSLKDVFIHLLIMLSLFISAVVIFFYVYLPFTTRHGETIEVPKLAGLSLQETESLLESKHLKYQVNDSAYTPGTRPFTILSQHPIAGSLVKESRKIYLSISSKNPPKVKMPALVDGSLKSAEIALKGYGLVLGKVKSVPSPYLNLVVEQYANGSPVKPGVYLAKGTEIDLSVGDGSAGAMVEVPDLTGMNVEAARDILLEKGLDLGLVEKEVADSRSEKIIRQKPATGSVRSGQMIDVWIGE